MPAHTIYGISALEMQRALGLENYRTAWRWLHKLLHAMVRPDCDQLSGSIVAILIPKSVLKELEYNF